MAQLREQRSSPYYAHFPTFTEQLSAEAFATGSKNKENMVLILDP